jgi:hypothetical protein
MTDVGKIMLGTIATFLLGGLGWFVTSFFAKPYLDFRNLRSQVHEEIVFTANVAPIGVENPRYREVADSLRRLGAKVLTTNETESRLLRWYLSRTGYDLASAGGGLIGLANALVDPHPAHRVINTDLIQVGLRLKRTSTPEYLSLMKDEIHQGRHR